MKSRGEKRREKIFEIYSRNFQLVKKTNPEIRTEPDFDDGYVCPICFNVFDKSYLNKEVENPLTLEDVPPKSLGGKPIILTCKECNSFCGHELDVHLTNRLIEWDVQHFMPNSRHKTIFEKNGHKMRGLIEVDEEGTVKLDLKDEWSDPKEKEKFIKEVFPSKVYRNSAFNLLDNQKGFKTNEFSIQFPSKSVERRVEIALLKSAYLFAFAKFGYSFLINGGLYKVREQILNPDKEILPKILWLNHDFPEKALGLNIISSPKELRCFLIYFELKTKSQKYKFAIVLPGPNEPGIEVYNNLEERITKGKSLSCRLEHIPNSNYVADKSLIWASFQHWQKICKD